MSPMKVAKDKSIFVCTACGYDSAKWLGKCPGCGGWNTLEEEREAAASLRGGSPREPSRDLGEAAIENGERLVTGLKEFDGLLGGGIVRGSFVLIGGEPGIGKSTLMLQVAARLAGRAERVLYVSAEESFGQMRMRAKRVGAGADSLAVLCATDVTAILEEARKIKAGVVIVDSIQIIYHPQIPSASGSVNQVRECAGPRSAIPPASSSQSGGRGTPAAS
ncbi:MAG: AAA family ATPase [Candidatus Aureabacteria bacterium]|nr:AAA family ATPase [Candidatus Auribacterota bacterium]